MREPTWAKHLATTVIGKMSSEGKEQGKRRNRQDKYFQMKETNIVQEKLVDERERERERERETH